MIQTGFESRIKVQDLIESQLPSFILDESPNAVEFLKQYYISQEYQGGPIDIADNLDQYLKLDNLTPEVVVDSTTLTSDIDENSIDISVSSTKGFPDRYGLLKIDDEIITYTGKTASSFTGCVRGFSGITNYQQDLSKSELIFEETVADSHKENTSIQNLSSLFLKDFYKKLKYTFAPGFENITLVDEIDAGNFIKRARDFYASKGTDESIRILFNVVFGETPKVINLEDYLLKSSSANYIRREIVLVEAISGNVKNIAGQTLFKSSDQSTNAPISNIESFNLKGKTYHKLELFIGFDDRSLIEGTFNITPNTKVLENVSAGDNVISVDSTIAFPESGELISGNNTISYTSKSINQFFGCSGIDETINATDNIRTNDTYFSYENGDITKKVELILFGIIDDLSQDKPGIGIYEGDIVTVKNFGDKIENTSKNYKEIFANSWIYNTRVRYTIDSVSKKLGSPIDRSSLKIGDFVEVLDRGSENVLSSDDVYISAIDLNTNTVTIENFTFDGARLYDIRRKLNKSSSSGSSFEYGDSSILSDVLNLYSDNDDYAYVASNSLPSETSDIVGFVNEYRLDIDENIRSVSISSTSNFGDYDAEREVYNSILLTSVPFITGDRIYYSSLEDSIGGLESGQSYYVEVLGSKIKLYYTLGLLEAGNNIEITPPTPVGSHTFVLYSQKDSILGSQKLLKKFPLDKKIEKGTGSETAPGAIGMLINGVEINNYKSNDSIYYGPLSDVNVVYGGEDYDVINLPKVEPNIGTAKIQPVISGVFENVYVDTQDYDIEKIVSINIDGGNGSGAVIEPVLSKRSRVVLFDAKESTNGGGINTITDRIVFSEEHNFANGEEVFYNPLGNESLVDLATGASYFVEVNNNFTVTLYNSLSDQQSQSNPITLSSGSGGTQQFSTAKRKNQVSYIQILEKGSGYTNRKLIVNPSGISTTKNTINFTNHGFESGEIIEYSFETAGISGISTTNQYYVLKNDNNSFRLCDAGIGGTITENYERKNYIEFDSSGSGYQYFKYPDISVSIKYSPVGFGTTTQEYKDLITTPVVKGNIIDSYLYDGGSDYGSILLNYEKKPIISIKNGKNASLSPIIINGSINRVNIGYGGIEYFSTPDLEVIDSSGSGTGAQLRSTIENGKIVSVDVINPGIGYSSNSTSIKIISSGKNANINPQVRKLTVNDSFERFDSGKVLLSGNDKLQYSVSKYFTELRESFLDTDSNSQSKIIGWAYDGNPIYGPYGNSDPNDISSEIKKLSSGYDIDISNVTNRPGGFSSGYFVEDYIFNNSGDLDEHNGRYEKNDDFPNGIYAYHATLDNSIIPQPEFPYFIGNSYNSKSISDDLDQSYNFNDSKLLRNTLPYKVSENNVEYDFFDEVNDSLDQRIEIESISSGSIDSINILNPGDNYKVGDILSFNENGTSGQGLNANVSSIKGKEITEVNVSSTSYLNSIFTWKNSDEVKISILPNHNFSSGDYITISGFSTSLSKLNGFYRIQVPSYANGRCLSTITSASVGDTGEIYISPIPENISIGSSINIGVETLKILGIFRNENILRIERGSTGVSHTVGTAVTFLSDSFTISENIDKFDSTVNTKAFFNPRESVGVSTISGVGYSTSFVFGNISNVTRSIPAKSIHIENHPFTTNQPVIYTPNGSALGVSTDGINQFNLPSNLFIVNKQPNLIGIKTQINSSELFFHTNGDNDDQYLFESNYTQILGDVEENEIAVSVSTSHSLQVGDIVELNVEPNLSVGIGTSTAVRVLYKSQIDAIVINPIGFNSTGVSTTTNEITITDHGLETGNKVFYEDSSNPSVDNESYYVFKINKNTFNLCETYFDTQQEPPNVVSFASTGGSTQTLSLINPEINPTRNNNLVFDLTDSSLSGYELKIFCENTFKNEFVSTGSTNSFTISGVGTVGVSSTASLTLEYNSDLPQELYYTLEQNGEQIGYDDTVKNYSKLKYQNSKYTNTYKIDEVTDTTFTINSRQKLERLSYASTETDTLEYSTTSNFADGPVNVIDILSSGFGYKKLPTVESTNSTNGKDLFAIPQSKTIGKEKTIRVINDGFIYSSDKTLSPKATLPYFIITTDSNTIESIDVIESGNGYTSSPDIVLVNADTKEVINSGLFEVNIQGQSISSVDIVSEPKGLPNNSVEIFTTNNSNGISILEVESSNTGIFTCLISTPPLGFSTFIPYPFSIGEKVFIEGIQKFSIDGSGFNSEDYGYRLLTISDIDSNLVPNKITIDASDLTTNTGIAKTEQDLSGTIIKESDYPSLTANQKISQFQIGEKVSVNGTSTELKVIESIGNNLRLVGDYNLSVNDVIIGNESGSIATINYIENNSGVYEIEYSNTKKIGWSDNTGKLNEDSQVTPNNDYYQNLSYSIKSSITYKDQQSPVENLVHTSGLKNFADTELLKSSGIGSVSVNNSSDTLYDISVEKRVDSINRFDHVYDIDVLNSRSKYLKLQNKRLTDYTELKTLNALRIDDISDKFSNFESQNTLFLNIEEVDDRTFYNYLIRVTDLDNTQIQLTDITILSNGLDSYIVENESISNNGLGELHEDGEQYGSFELYTNPFEETFLRFVPVDPYDTEYDLKIIRQVFDETNSGVGTTSLGFVNLTGKENIESTGIGTTSIIQVNSSDFNSLYITSQVINTETDDIDYVKLYVIHDGSNTYMSEYYIDTDSDNLTGFNNNQIGSFYSNLDGGILSVYHENDTNDNIKIRSNIVGFGNTSVGVGTFRYILEGQTEGTERSAIYESNYYSTVSAASTVIQTLDVSVFNSSKCIVEVSAGSTKALHQVMLITDGTDVYTQQAPFLSVSGTETFDDASGIGTFGGEISGSDILLSFYPDPDQTGEINIEVFSKSLYTDLDTINEPESLDYGIISESIDEKFYNAINGDRINRVNFGLFDNNIPIFTKVFNPNSVSLAQTSGIFTIKNHFFSDNEELIYTPSSSFIGIAASAMKYTATDELPSQVFAIKLSEDTFQISTTRSGTAVTFTSLGSGNQHQFTMSERNTKTLITLDDLVQYPIAATKITHNLTGNVGGGITETTEIISLSGISTINPKDILRIDDEYMGVINVGLGTTNIGPIINEGTENLVQVDRGFVGSSATSHTDSTLVRVYKGAYNIIDNEIYFAEAPRGNPQIDKTDLNLEFETSTFTGRVFLRSDYTGNQIYDDISDEFTGIGRTFTLKVGGANTTGLGTDGGSGLVFINSIYQSPKTDNNPNIFNYEIEENTVVGVTTLTFSGITKPDIDPLEYVTSDYDVNLNETPRGGIIISYGSTPGLGFAPLVGASVTAVVSGGVITSVGLGTTDNVGSGYNGLVSIGISVYEDGHSGNVADISASIGVGGTLSFTVNDGGTGYTNPQIFVSDPAYENLPVIGVSRLGIGATTDTGIGLLVDLEVGASTGIGSTLFEVKNFKFARPGYSFQRGDVFKPVGLVTDASLSSPLSDFTITVVDTFSDSFAAWEFGELDYIDSIASLQDGERRIFPLRYNSELLSFEPEEGSPVEENLNNLLIIFINGILQDPGVSYNFSGGTSFSFTTAPKPEDNVQIYFYKGAPNDTEIFDDINTTLEIGDTVQVLKNNDYPTTLTQDERFVYNLSFSDKFETNPYTGVGINEDPDKAQPLTWTKKKRGSIINGEYVSKVRDSIEALVFPTARVIKDFTSTDTEIFVENAELFQYEDNLVDADLFESSSIPFDALLVNGISTTVTGSVEKINNFTNVIGFSGFITGIATAPGIGTDLALQFNIIRKNEISGLPANIEPELQIGYPIYIYDTRIGSGVTSIDDSDSTIVGIGTTFLDNIYYVSSISSVGNIGIITCNVKSDSNIIGLSTTGISSSPVGQFSWGRLSNSTSLERLNPISIGVSGNIVSGLSTYPTIQRRGGVNLRKTGALPKTYF